MTQQPKPPPAIQIQLTPGRPALLLSEEEQVVYLLVEAQPPTLPALHKQLPVNLCLVLDRSSSMRGDRLYQVKQAAMHIIDQLNQNDYFSLVVFNDRAEVVVPCQHTLAKDDLRRAINNIEAKGGTEMATGLDLGLQEIERGIFGQCISQIILLTDGQTYGDEGRCVELARQAQSRGIGITALGIGQEWNEDLMETITAWENSRTEYITSAQQIVSVFADELKRLHSILAQSVELLFYLRPGVEVRSAYRVRPFIGPLRLIRLDDTRQQLGLGDWGSLDPQAILLELVIPPLPAGPQPFMRLELRYIFPALGPQQLQTVVDYVLPVVPAAQLRPDVDGVVKHWLERTVAHRLQATAWKQVAEGKLEEATRRLRMAGTRLLEAGETALAQTVQEEATRLLRSGATSEEGRKRIRYGTRGLIAQAEQDPRK